MLINQHQDKPAMMLAPGSTGEMRLFHRDTALGKGKERDNSFTNPH